MISKTVTRLVIHSTLTLILSTLWWPALEAVAADVTVYKDARCGCCAKWVEHLNRDGFHVTTHNVASVDKIKFTHGVPAQLASCHTAIVDGYVVEGHVPADVLQRLLRERPRVKGIAVPGMPAGAPGMEGPRAQRYDIVSFDAQGKTARYESR
ncbi:MAG: DUF411 domain-containing protein [Gammaproteobacteria bacterium]|nr:DUF411 domain-containing protein [Gammaproteobacteria bacterium]